MSPPVFSGLIIFLKAHCFKNKIEGAHHYRLSYKKCLKIPLLFMSKNMCISTYNCAN